MVLCKSHTSLYAKTSLILAITKRDTPTLLHKVAVGAMLMCRRQAIETTLRAVTTLDIFITSRQ
jgi:hypothetical protein